MVKRTSFRDPVFPTGILLMAILLLAGCAMPPDISRSPEFGPLPDIAKDHHLLAVEPIPSTLLENASKYPQRHRIALLEQGDTALLARIHLIRAARYSIDIQTFIYKYDETGCWVYRELLAAARRGVRVRLLVDHVVSPGTSLSEYAGMAAAHANLEIRLFRPISEDALMDTLGTAQSAVFRFSTMNYRMHNKVMTVDGQVAIVGGRNYQNAYYDRDPRLCFRDRDVMVSGPVLANIGASFEEFWESPDSIDVLRMNDIRRALKSGKTTLPASLTQPLPEFFTELDQLADLRDITEARPQLLSMDVEYMEFMADGPVKVTRFNNPLQVNPFSRLYKLFEESEREILIQTPYPVIDNRTYKILRKIRKKKQSVRVRLSTNSLSSSDHMFVGGVALKQRRFQVEGLGIELYLAKPVPEDIREFVPRHDVLAAEANKRSPDWEEDPYTIPLEKATTRYCIHSKSLVVDREVSLVGSHNFDPRSVYLNSECMLVIKDPVFGEKLARTIETSMRAGNSWVVAPRKLPPIVGEVNSLITLVSSNLPMFDIWPLDHVSCYELKEGCEPLLPYDEQFHENYSDVGPFPGLNLGLDQVKAQMLRAFAGPTAPLM